jgi:Domain of unknown function (DUF4062)
MRSDRLPFPPWPEPVRRQVCDIFPIYVSSTFEDLKTHREAVASTLRQMHDDVICMEDYVARDQRPLDKCLADVSACDIYVGIFALRYGFVPTADNPDNRSNIELEAHVHDGLSLAYVGLGAFDRAYEHAQTAVDRYKEAGLRDPLGYVCNVQGMACMGLRRFDEARTLLGQGRDFGREDCNPRLEGFCLVNLARLARMTADADEATRIADAAYAVLSGIGAPEAQAALGLRDTVGASRTGDRVAEAQALLACSRASIPSPDLFPPVDLLSEAEELVRDGNALDLHAEVSACLQMLEQRRQQGSAPVRQ